MSVNLAHFAAGWGDTQGYACVYAGRQQRFFQWPERRAELEALLNAHNQRHDAYISWCLFSEPSRTAGKASILPGILIDLDLATGKHAKVNYPPNATVALSVVRETPLPEPSRIMSSGGGLYLHYLFSEPMPMESSADRARAAAVTKGVTAILRSAMQKRGWSLDDVSDHSRITRPVGARNWKYEDVRHVELVSETDERLGLADYEMLIGAGLHRAVRDNGAVVHGSDNEEGRGDFRLIEKHCGFVRHLAENPQEVSEPEWYALATLAANCENGEERFHALSALDGARYREDETAAKLRHAKKVRPRTCSGIAANLAAAACIRCPFRAAEMTSPYKLAFGHPELLELQAQFVLSAHSDSYHSVSGDLPALPAISFRNHFAHRLDKPDAFFVHDDRSPKVVAMDYIAGD